MSKLKAALRALLRGDKALAARELAGDLGAEPAEAFLLRGILLRSVEDLRRGVALGPSDAGLLTQAAEILLKQQRLVAAREALACLAGLVTGADRARVKRRLASIELSLGRYHDGIGEYRAALDLTPESVQIATELAEQLRGLSDFEAAFEVIEPYCARSPELGSMQVELLVDLERFDEARAAAVATRDVKLLMRAGAFVEARAILEEDLAKHPDDVDVLTSLAELMSWWGEQRRALDLAEKVLEIEPTSTTALRIRAVARLFGDEIERAEADLARILELDPQDAPGLVWQGEVERRHARWDSAFGYLGRGIERTRGYPLGAHATLVSAHAGRQQFKGRLDVDLYRELCLILTPLFASIGVETEPPRSNAEVHARLQAALDAMQGNRGARPSFVHEGKLTPLDLPVHARFLARSLQELLRTRTPEFVISALEALARERPGEPTIFCHVGEIHLWLGDYSRAETAFLAAIEVARDTRWAYVGLCAVEVCRGDYELAIEWCARGEKEALPGRTQYAYRGEAQRRLGDRERALADLELSLDLTPTRISAWLNLALVERDRAVLDSTFRAFQAQAPGLLDDACRELELESERLLGNPDAIARVFEHCLVMMRGNRASSLVSYFTASGALRFVPAPTPPR